MFVLLRVLVDDKGDLPQLAQILFRCHAEVKQATMKPLIIGATNEKVGEDIAVREVVVVQVDIRPGGELPGVVPEQLPSLASTNRTASRSRS
jgi:hypothetical protein